MSADTIIPFGFESFPVRGALIHLSRSWRRMLRDHDYDVVITETLGHAAAATGLIAQSLKFDGAITLQIQGAGVLRMLVMQCTSELELRGMASSAPDSTATDFKDLIDKGHCAVTVDTGERPYQGIVDINDISLAASLEHYFARSVQVPSHLALVADKEVAAGVLLQQVPGRPIDRDDWRRLHYLIETLSCRDFDGDAGITLIGKLFAEDDVRVHEARAVNFRCRCSQNKTEDVLKMLGEQEARETLAEQGAIEVVCEYCGHKRHFDAVDVERLFVENVVQGPDSVQ
ncbi:MAG: Hsp33 family molecular chaperone HslO [Gammaproteobacteria bacterium]|nr:Hsp33 family molecular chaperone HslO [Gammaproteobacteria bacterium]MBU2677965.1 Hsp33 family molecular chaperone HslO [Gammaproteobacteria bacterium]NNC57843.1 Hsp33 family molecular chaperone HslO [Woeseiaceae bacterium]NNL51699.1 Hsp33 family molecular chaperone HslO [Woeseiaceae bacterium]